MIGARKNGQLKKLWQRPDLPKHFAVCNILLFLPLLLYDGLTFFIPLIHLGIGTVLLLIVVADVLCVTAQAIVLSGRE